MWLTDAQIAQLSLADTKQRCEKEEESNKENLQKKEENYVVGIIAEQLKHNRTVLSNRDVCSSHLQKANAKLWYDTK